jgi:hypothetical protein
MNRSVSAIYNTGSRSALDQIQATRHTIALDAQIDFYPFELLVDSWEGGLGFTAAGGVSLIPFGNESGYYYPDWPSASSGSPSPEYTLSTEFYKGENFFAFASVGAKWLFSEGFLNWYIEYAYEIYSSPLLYTEDIHLLDEETNTSTLNFGDSTYNHTAKIGILLKQ